MWATNSLWFEIAIVSIIYALGNIIFGHFEERTPKLRRTAKYLLTVLIICVLSFYFSRTVAMIALGAFLIPALYVHGYYLPMKKGINGLTGEPKSRYYDFRGWDKNVFKNQ
jgi:predicted MFS family arabinose efflux permease